MMMRVIRIFLSFFLSFLAVTHVFAKSSQASPSKEGAQKDEESKVVSKKIAVGEEVSKEAKKPNEKASRSLCEVTLLGTDQMKYVGEDGKSITDILVDKKKCSEFTIKLKYSGKLSRNIMGHNLIIAKEQDVKKVSADAIKSMIKGNYLPAAGHSLVIAQGKELLGGGPGEPREDTIVIQTNLLKTKEKYIYFCGFPGHISMMRGKLVTKE